LIDSESRLAALVLNLNSGVILEDENRKIVLSNNKFCELFSIEAKPESIIGIDCELGYEQNKNLFKDPSAFIERINQIVGGKVAVIGDVLEMADGKILERNYLPVFVGEKIKGFLWTFTDITLEKNYNLSLEALKTKYSRIIANMNLGLLEVDKEDNILMMNQSFSDMSGYSEAEILGKNANSIFVSKEDQKLITSQSNNRFVGNYNSYEIKVKNKKGEFKHWFVSGAPNYDLLGEFIGSIGIHLDITAIKELELQKECIFLV
jgi:PAS domain S-box-containing protein